MQTESKIVVVRGCEGQGNGEMLVKGEKLPVLKWISCKDLITKTTLRKKEFD